jgi:hypothetical protein
MDVVKRAREGRIPLLPTTSFGWESKIKVLFISICTTSTHTTYINYVVLLVNKLSIWQ